MSATQIAEDARNFFGDACADIAMQKPWEDRFNKKAAAWHKKAKAAGCQDILGAYTDELYNDADTASDFLGDRLCDECGDDDVLHEAVVQELERLMGWMPKSLFKELSRTA